MKRQEEVRNWRFQPIDKQAAIPAYLQITAAIKEVLRTGGLPQGSPLPPERVLCDQFGVSRMTMREANNLLEREGYIERHAGRGTFVALHRILKRQQEMRSFSEEMLARGAALVLPAIVPDCAPELGVRRVLRVAAIRMGV